MPPMESELLNAPKMYVPSKNLPSAVTVRGVASSAWRSFMPSKTYAKWPKRRFMVRGVA